jgi:hypothetical protein
MTKRKALQDISNQRSHGKYYPKNNIVDQLLLLENESLVLTNTIITASTIATSLPQPP